MYRQKMDFSSWVWMVSFPKYSHICGNGTLQWGWTVLKYITLHGQHQRFELWYITDIPWQIVVYNKLSDIPLSVSTIKELRNV